MSFENKINLKISSLDGVLFDDNVCYVNVPQVDGSAGFLAGHPPLISALKAGVVICRYSNGDEQEFNIEPGILNVNYNTIEIVYC